MEMLSGFVEYGVLGLLVGYFLWRDWKREQDTQQVMKHKDEQIEILQKEIRSDAVETKELVIKCEQALNRQADVTTEVLNWLKSNTDTDTYRRASGTHEGIE